VFIDTPGIFAPKRRLDRAMVTTAWGSAHDADIVVLLIDAKRGIDEEAAVLGFWHEQGHVEDGEEGATGSLARESRRVIGKRGHGLRTCGRIIWPIPAQVGERDLSPAHARRGCDESVRTRVRCITNGERHEQIAIRNGSGSVLGWPLKPGPEWS